MASRAAKSTELASTAGELYVVPPAEFVSARNALAKTLIGPDAATIRQLRKPAPAAWLSNVLAVRYAEELRDAIQVGTQLQEAQRSSDRARITELSRQRREVVQALVHRGADIAKSAGVKVSTAALEDLAQTINAALADDEAAEVVCSGLLARPLQSTGLEPVDLEGALALGADVPRARRAHNALPSPQSAQAETRRKAEAAQLAAEQEAARRRKAVEQRRAKAARGVERLEAQLAALDASVASTRCDLDVARAALARVERELEDAD